MGLMNERKRKTKMWEDEDRKREREGGKQGGKYWRERERIEV